MRAIAQFEAKVEAERFGAVLFAQGIENRVDKSRDGTHTVWVFDEAQLEIAQQAFEVYKASPNDPRIHEALKQAAQLEKQVKAAEKQERKTAQSRRPRPMRSGVAPLTFVLIATCVVIYVLIEGFEMRSLRDALLFAKNPGLAASLGMNPWEATGGEPWRLVTPAFMHASVARGWFAILHIVFNMMWLKDLGTIFERFHSTWLLALLVLVSAVFSNTLQYVMVGPYFVGMSGVVYALFGYLWLRGKLDPWAGYRLPRQLVVWMMVWFAFGWLGNFGVANWAHAGGLIVGALLGWLGSLGRKPPGMT